MILLELADDLDVQDHAGTDHPHVAIVTFQGPYRGAVGVSDGIQRFAGAYAMMDYRKFLFGLQTFDFRGLRGRRLGACGLRFGALGLAARSVQFGIMRAGRNWQVQGEDSASGKAVGGAANAVPAAKLLRRDAEIVGYALDRVSLANFVARDSARVSSSVARGMLAGSDRD